MPFGVQQTIVFDFQNTVSGIQSPVGLVSGGFSANGLLSGTATFENALDGITFTFSSSDVNVTSFDSGFVNNAIDHNGTGVLGFSYTALTFSNIAFVISGTSDATGETQLIEFLNGTGAVVGSLTDAQVVDGTISFNGNFSSIRFTSSGGLSINSITTTINCFCAGTRIATPDGEVAVETLKAGDTVLRADGGVSTVKWLGRQDIDVRTSDPLMVNPICISAGALGENIPARDLWVTQDHAIGIGGSLINAGALVNGSSIYQVREMPLDGFTYYHIETDAHELILAEGVAAETYIDYRAEGSFENADERMARIIPEMDLPRVSSARMLPEGIRDRLLVQDRRKAA